MGSFENIQSSACFPQTLVFEKFIFCVGHSVCSSYLINLLTKIPYGVRHTACWNHLQNRSSCSKLLVNSFWCGTAIFCLSEFNAVCHSFFCILRTQERKASQAVKSASSLNVIKQWFLSASKHESFLEGVAIFGNVPCSCRLSFTFLRISSS